MKVPFGKQMLGQTTHKLLPCPASPVRDSLRKKVPTHSQVCFSSQSAGRSTDDARLGKCYLVGAGPGDPELLTVKAARLIESVDVIIHDELGTEGILEMSACAEKIYVGKRGGRASITQPEIDELILEQCRQGKVVVRLKGGCPSVFSRIGSEIAALASAGIDYEIVPGISSALYAPLAVGFPLTDKEDSTAFAVTSAHVLDAIDWEAMAKIDTRVFLMGGRNLPHICELLIDAGCHPETPVVIVQSAGTPEQRDWRGTLDTIVERTAGVKLSPCIIVVGKVAAKYPSI